MFGPEMELGLRILGKEQTTLYWFPISWKTLKTAYGRSWYAFYTLYAIVLESIPQILLFTSKEAELIFMFVCSLLLNG